MVARAKVGREALPVAPVVGEGADVRWLGAGVAATSRVGSASVGARTVGRIVGGVRAGGGETTGEAGRAVAVTVGSTAAGDEISRALVVAAGVLVAPRVRVVVTLTSGGELAIWQPARSPAIMSSPAQRPRQCGRLASTLSAARRRVGSDWRTRPARCRAPAGRPPA